MQKSKPQSIVIDTNLWVSFLISHNLQKLDHLLLSNRIRLFFSVELLEEIRATIAKPKLKKYFAENAMRDMLSALEDHIELITVTSKVKICRDKKDDFLLALAKDSKADFLLTGDKDLLDLKTYGKTKIVTISDFLLEMK